MKEISIIVCDDEKDDRDSLIRGLREVWPDARIDEAGTGEEVLAKLEDGEVYDFVFLDIYMRGIDGIETGHRIRGSNQDTRLVFVSNSREFGPETYDLDAAYYLIKPYRLEQLERIRNRYGEERDEKSITFYDTASRKEQRILCRRISYIESAHNYVLIHLVTGDELKIRKGMQEMEGELDERFLRINRGIIVNMDVVEQMTSDACEIDGVTFMLSRRKRGECRKKYNDYLFSHFFGGGGRKKMTDNKDIFLYVAVQFLGYLLQLLPTMFLLFVPFGDDSLRFSKRRILMGLGIFYIFAAGAGAVFLGIRVEAGVKDPEIIWTANLIFTTAILVGTAVYFLSLKKWSGGKLLFFTFVLEYGLVLYTVNTIAAKFTSPVLIEYGSPYEDLIVLSYLFSTAVSFPFAYLFLREFRRKNLLRKNQKSMRVVTVCSMVIVVLTMVALQMDVSITREEYGGTAGVYESVLLLCLMAVNIITYVIYFFCVYFEQQKDKVKSMLLAYEMQYENVCESMEKEKRLHHNIRHHFRTLGALASDGKCDEIQKYLSGYLKNLDELETKKVSQNPVINSVLSYYVRLAEEENILVRCEIGIGKECLLDIKDMTVLLGNAMENAIEATRGCMPGEAAISFMMRQYHQSILIKIENTVCPGMSVGTDIRKKKEKGYGLASIEMIANRYGGTMEAWQQEDKFILRVVLNMPDMKKGRIGI